MVRRQREKQYQSSREHRDHAQMRSGTTTSGSTVQRRLPFTHCALSLTAFETPVCNREGIVFENTALFPFVMKHRIDPVSGAPMESRDIITLNMDRDEEGRWQCPVLTKPFADHTKIIGILQPGGKEANVISYEAYHELNVKTKNYEDLISGVKFDKHKDLLVLNDPDDEDLNRRRDINHFYHILHSRELQTEQNTEGNVRHSVTATRVMEKLKQQKAKEEVKSDPSLNDSLNKESMLYIVIDGEKVPIMALDVTGVEFTTGRVSVSLTSSASAIAHDNVQRVATVEEVLQSQFQTMRKLKKKGYVILETNMGNITLELHCDMAPRTCTNFLGLCHQHKYDDTTCHRLIKSFMVQLGKAPKGEEEESLWGDAFPDEFDERLSHNEEGVLSMANAGPGTNRRQFFITFQSCTHLDRKHSIFGKVIKGMDVVKNMETIPTDKKERPMEEIRILKTVVQTDPAEEAKQLDLERIEKIIRERRKASSSAKSINESTSRAPDKGSAVGKYLTQNTTGKASLNENQGTGDTSRLAPPPKKTKFGNFSGW
ncbi:peptidyl-prolyl cis-trans isomerase-like 2 [Fistulifera solaris]|jgi:peptidyl-prolyl cis-trans isomerase-like protein 2|uniref:Peptidyl-prolyl cis-trans isomerase-like 2 n=1 Tax=Fistulifera solaris TaxID=1519565 RepID=A0A1Z5JPZ8_FISSO|nr:peptidyl-prolyl cis-trans isomerase-like 2 [Fistulifera solaris]|eukprot:GAX15966.1 peptidyl-prolyl cis-trans isomerase-like 2 [Fistulifera solaris]